MTPAPKPLPPIMNLDPRVKLGLALVLGVATWHAGWAGLGLYGLGLVWTCATLAGFWRDNAKAFAAYAWFALFWTAAAFGVDIWGGAVPEAALSRAGLLGARLAVILFLGLALARSTSPRALGLALAWALRPVMGRRAWKTALALALMVHFLPLAWQSWNQIKTAARLRLKSAPWTRKALLLPQAALRCLAQKTWTQTLALAARGLDREEAWRPAFTANPGHWLAGTVLALGTVAAAMI